MLTWLLRCGFATEAFRLPHSLAYIWKMPLTLPISQDTVVLVVVAFVALVLCLVLVIRLFYRRKIRALDLKIGALEQEEKKSSREANPHRAAAA